MYWRFRSRKSPDTVKRLVVFDLDGTLAESKSAIDAEMAQLLDRLLAIVPVAIISGGTWQQFASQVLPHLRHEGLSNLSLLPTCGTRFYRYESRWELLYSEDFTESERKKIIDSLQQTIASTGGGVARVWGDVIEDRGSQITLSALGQQAPLEEKKKWDPDFSKRKRMKTVLDTLIPEF